MIPGKMSPCCLTVGVKRLPVCLAVRVKRDSGSGGKEGPAVRWMPPKGSKETLKISKGVDSLGIWARDEKQVSLSSGIRKHGGLSGGLGWRICAEEEALMGGGGRWKEEEGDGEVSLSSVVIVA